MEKLFRNYHLGEGGQKGQTFTYEISSEDVMYNIIWLTRPSVYSKVDKRVGAKISHRKKKM